MKKLMFILVVLGLWGSALAAPEVAQPTEEAPLQLVVQSEEEKQLEQELERLDREVEDLDARYWAYRVLYDKNITLEELKKYSANWLGDGERQYQLIEQAVKKGNVQKLTPEEQRKLDAQKKKIRMLLNPSAQDMDLVATLSQTECADLKARYWAYRIQHDEDKWYKPGWEDILLFEESYYTEAGDLIVNLPRNIKRGKETKQLFLKYLKDKKLPPLSAEQQKRLDGCRYFDEQVFSITRYPQYQYTGE